MNTFYHIIFWVLGLLIGGMTGYFLLNAFMRLIEWILRNRKPESIFEPPAISKEDEPVEPVLISTLGEITYEKWMQCAVDSKFFVLIKSGHPSKEDLFRTWISLLSQYYQAIGSKEAAKYIRTVAKIEALNTKIFQVLAIIAVLRQLYSEKLIDQLKIWGYRRQFTKESIDVDLEMVEREVGNDRVKLEKIRLEYEKSEKRKKQGSEPTTKEHYLRILYAIEEFRCMTIHADSISMEEFCIHYKRLQERNTLLENKAKNKYTGYGRREAR